MVWKPESPQVQKVLDNSNIAGDDIAGDESQNSITEGIENEDMIESDSVDVSDPFDGLIESNPTGDVEESVSDQVDNMIESDPNGDMGVSEPVGDVAESVSDRVNDAQECDLFLDPPHHFS